MRGHVEPTHVRLGSSERWNCSRAHAPNQKIRSCRGCARGGTARGDTGTRSESAAYEHPACLESLGFDRLAAAGLHTWPILSWVVRSGAAFELRDPFL